MRKIAALILPLTLVAASPTTTPRSEFEAALADAGTNFERRDYLGSSAALRKALQIVNDEFQAAAEDAMPAPPVGMKPVRRMNHPAPSGTVRTPRTPLSGMFARPVERDFHSPETNERVKIRLVPDDARTLQLIELVEDEEQSETFGDSEQRWVIAKGNHRFVARTVLGSNHGLDVVWYGEDRANLEAWLASMRLDRLHRAVSGR